jgi:SAM-dependent methyltransferase
MAVAPDGSPVELYLRLPPRGEAEIVDGVIEAGAEILELGCGVGRVTHELLRLGHPVVAVDESPEMLEHVRGATTVCSPIESLVLARRFSCVLLMSNLVNTTDSQRDSFLATCARHVAPDGVVLIERHEPDWRPTEKAPGRLGDVVVSLSRICRSSNSTFPELSATSSETSAGGTSFGLASWTIESWPPYLRTQASSSSGLWTTPADGCWLGYTHVHSRSVISPAP